MIRTGFTVDLSMYPSPQPGQSTDDDRFITVYSAWMNKPHVKYLYAHGRIVDHEIFDEPFKMGKAYYTTWELPEEHEIWFILNWGEAPGVEML